MLLSKKEAIERYRSATGRKVVDSRKAINTLTLDIGSGKRGMVNSWHLDRLILSEERNQESTAMKGSTIRPISERRGQEIRDRCI